jgi:hypothetical protein
MRGRSRVFLGYLVLSNLSDAAFFFLNSITMHSSLCIVKKKHPRMVLFCCKIEDGQGNTCLTRSCIQVYAPGTCDVCSLLALARASGPREWQRQPRLAGRASRR